MTKPRRVRRTNGPELRLIAGEANDAGNPDAPTGVGSPELWEMLTAAGVPQDALHVLGEGGDPGEIMRQLVEVGALPTPEQSLDGLVDSWRPVLRPGCDPLSAELVGSAFLGMMRAAVPDDAELPELLGDLVAHAQTYLKPESLAMLRVLAVLAPAPVRPAAAAAADRLAAAGLKDRPWARALGHPEVGACFGYADELGAQEAVALTFRYGRRPHALAVLIDHDLGGGVKDCWPTDRPDRIRTDYERAARQHGMEFRDFEPDTARAVLESALAKPPCPVAPEQVESVRDHIDLLRQRVALLPAADPVGIGASTGTGAGTAGGTAAAPPPAVYRLKITLRGSKPPIWRRLEVPAGITLTQLHRGIQEAFGWEDHHLWVFQTPYGDFGRADRELGHRSGASKRLEDVLRHGGERIRYTYDFGDGWEHDVLLEDVLAAEPAVAYPRCTGGRRAGPPEDSGGIWGYAELLDILADPDHPEHRSRLEWLGLRSAAEFQPAAFDPERVNAALSGLTRVLVKG